jgi:hypothetical protein
MNTKGFGLIRILVIVNILYSFPALAKSDLAEFLSGRSQVDCGEIEDKVKKDKCIDKQMRQMDKQECQQYEDSYSSTISDIQEGCKGTGLSFTACVERARSCNGAQNAALSSLASFAGGMSMNACATKEEAQNNRDLQEKQQDDLKDTQKDLTDKMDQASQDLSSAMQSEYQTLMDISQKNKEMRDVGLDTANEAQKIDRDMRRNLVSNLQNYHQGQTAIAKLNRDLVALTAKLGDLPKNYMDECVQTAKDNQKTAIRTLQQMKSELGTSLTEASSGGSTTISSFSSARNTAIQKYNDAKKNFEQDMKDNYQACLKQKQKLYKVEYDALKKQIDDGQDQIRTTQDQVDAIRTNMQEDLGQAQQERSYTINKAESDLRARGENINLTRMQYNVQINAAMQRVQVVQAEMTQFQQQAQSQMRMNMMSGLMGMLTGSGAAGLGDVVPYIEKYDKYQQDMPPYCKGSSGGRDANVASNGGRSSH